MRTFRLLLILAILGVAITACASSAAQIAPQPPAEGPVGGDTDGSGPDPAYGSGTDGVVDQGPTGGETGGGTVGKADDAKIIRTGSMDLEVSDVPAAVKTARSAILAMGGYVGASNAGTDGDTPYAEISYRIPADRWEDALAELRTLGGLTTKLVSEQTQAVEVTAQVVDLQARIRNLQVSETALQGIAARATKISDILEIQAQLTGVRGEIEQLQAQLKDLDDRTSFATVTARYSMPLVAAVQVAAKGWEAGTAVDQALASLIGTLQGLTDAGIWFVIVWLPILLVLGVFAGIAIGVGRRLGVGRRATMPPPTADLPAAG